MVDVYGYKKWDDDDMLLICQDIKNRRTNAFKYRKLMVVAREQGIEEDDVAAYLLGEVGSLLERNYALTKSNEHKQKEILLLKKKVADKGISNNYLDKVKSGEIKPALRKDVSDEDIAMLRKIGWSNRKIAEFKNISPSTVTKRMKKYRKEEEERNLLDGKCNRIEI